MLVFDATTGAPAAFLLDGGLITDVRTGAAGGVAARHLAPERVEAVAVIGTGGQAGFQMEALARGAPGVRRGPRLGPEPRARPRRRPRSDAIGSVRGDAACRGRGGGVAAPTS